MKIENTNIEEVKLLSPKVFEDERGFFFESYNDHLFKKQLGLNINFVQDNHSKSSKGTLRGLHYQLAPATQGKLIRVVKGVIFDVAVDIRKGSRTLSKWVGVILSDKNKKQLWIPEGFAHGFLTISETAECIYKTTDFYRPELERGIIWNDKSLGIKWPDIGLDIKLSNKDEINKTFADSQLL